MIDRHTMLYLFNKILTRFIQWLKVGITKLSLQIPQNSTYSASIGGRQDQLSSFHGAIDEVYIFKRALDGSEILKLSVE